MSTDGKSLEEWEESFQRMKEMREARGYKRFDQMSLAELEALVEKLNKIIADIKARGGS